MPIRGMCIGNCYEMDGRKWAEGSTGKYILETIAVRLGLPETG